MTEPTYPRNCIKSHCRSKRFRYTTEPDGKITWHCLILKCSSTWTVTKEGTDSK